MEEEPFLKSEQSNRVEPLSLEPSLHPLLRIAGQVHLLKQLPRTGWKVRGVHQVESVAAHSTGVGIWCLWLASRHEERTGEAVDRGVLLSLAILHDLSEAALGDLIPAQKAMLFGGNPTAQKRAIQQAEERFWDRLLATEDSQPLALATEGVVKEWKALWEAYREGSTVEATLVKRADLLDCVMQAIVYRSVEGVPLDEFARLIGKAAGDDTELATWLQEQWEQAR